MQQPTVRRRHCLQMLPLAGRLLTALLVTSHVLLVTSYALVPEDGSNLDELLDDGQLSLKEASAALRVPRQADGANRRTRQSDAQSDEEAVEEEEPGDPNCDFGSGESARLCDYANPKMAALSWMASTGDSSNWLGGPDRDAGDSATGGYAFFETSSMPKDNDGPNKESAMLESPSMMSTGPAGKCLKFAYSLSGLSVDRLRVLLHPVSAEEKKENGTADHNSDVVLWMSGDVSGSAWRRAQHLYTFPEEHTLVFEAIPMKGDTERAYRGYVAVDSVDLADGDECGNQCRFESRFCSWTQDGDDDFQWSLGRGTNSDKTGPLKDHGSSEIAKAQPMGSRAQLAGGYAYIDSSEPRRPGDRARLLSADLPPTSETEPMCFRFWTHMYGQGIGSLRVLKISGSDEKTLWSLSGAAGNDWYQGQVPVSSTERYQLAVEAEVGMPRQGDIAVDDISLTPGVCPSSPLAASDDSIDCTFEVELCGWSNPGRQDGLDLIDWERTTGINAVVPRVDHTKRTERGSLLQLMYNNPQRAGDYAWVVSPSVQGSSEPRCLTFWYYMDLTVPTTTRLQVGSLRVLSQHEDEEGDTVRRSIWRVSNDLAGMWQYGQVTVDRPEMHKVIFEGMWGGQTRGAIALDDITYVEGACSQRPAYAAISEGDCDFSRGACDGWSNTTSDDSGSSTRWKVATERVRVNGLNDHTLRTPTGYAFADIFRNSPVTMRLQSPVLDEREDRGAQCLTFYYAALSSESDLSLSVIQQVVPEVEGDEGARDDETKRWTLTGREVIDPSDHRISWKHGEVELVGNARTRVIFELRASNYGFALDDISIRPGSCRIRPEEADPESRNRDDEESVETK